MAAPSKRANGDKFRQVPKELRVEVQADVARAGGEQPLDSQALGATGTTMFDLPGSEDNTVTVLLPQSEAQRAPSQALVRIKSRGDGRRYLGIVSAGCQHFAADYRQHRRQLVVALAKPRARTGHRLLSSHDKAATRRGRSFTRQVAAGGMTRTLTWLYGHRRLHAL